MSVSPSFTVTPLSPRVSLYDGTSWMGTASFISLGGVTSSFSSYRLEDHYELDRIMVSADDNLDNTLNSGTVWYRHSCFRTYVSLSSGYWASDTQVIMIFDVETIIGPQDIQVFVGSDLVREETIDGRENIVIVYDFVPSASVVIRPKTLYKKLHFYKASVFVV